jgi:hypothetical protein
MNTPIILIEVVLVFGGVLLFGWWQLRSIKRDQQKAAEERHRQGSVAKCDEQPTETHDPPGS